MHGWNKVNMVGAGMMVGTALGVIIPEGAGAFYAAYPGPSLTPPSQPGMLFADADAAVGKQTWTMHRTGCWG